MNILLEIFLTFAKIGLFTFGGGYAMISMIENICVERKNWITHDELMHVTVLAESTPGPIAINCATYTGYKKAGIKGAFVATVGMIVPSFLIIYFISVLLRDFFEITWIASAFKGVKVAVGILILDAAVTMIKKMQKKKLSQILMLLSCVVMFFGNVFSIKFSSIHVMITAGIISLCVFMVCGAPQGKGGAEK